MKTIYVAIGNSDDRLPQWQWSEFVSEVYALVRKWSRCIHFGGCSPSAAAYQNFAWVFEIETDAEATLAVAGAALPDSADERLRQDLLEAAVRFRQDAIVWGEVDNVEFISPHPEAAESWANWARRAQREADKMREELKRAVETEETYDPSAPA